MGLSSIDPPALWGRRLSLFPLFHPVQPRLTQNMGHIGFSPSGRAATRFGFPELVKSASERRERRQLLMAAGQYESELITSPLLRVPSPHQTVMATESLMNLTLPSPNMTLAPPG